MSCMKNVDPYNNAPPPRKGGGGCSTGSCGSKPAMNQQYQQPQQQQIPSYGGPMRQGRPDPQTENQLLIDDLKVAIEYIHQLGGSWPPPGQ